MTAFGDLLDDVERREKEFVVYRRPGDHVDDLFGAHNVRVVTRDLPPEGPAPFLVVSEDGAFLGALPLSALDGLLTPPIERPGEQSGVSPAYRALFEALDDTLFTSLSRRELLAVSREIEDRAFRVGRGTLRVNFQTPATFEAQAEVYRHLARATGLAVHVYGGADWTTPSVPGVSFHPVDDPERGAYWALAFDGGGDADQVCALVAHGGDDGYRGYWTNDPATVERVLAAFADG